MEKPFHIRDLLDTLHFLSIDEEKAETAGHAEVDEANRRLVESRAGDDDRKRLERWLAARRQADEMKNKHPGDLFGTASALLSVLLVCFAVTAGYGGVFSFLAYTGTEPVNVLVFFVLFILIQGILAAGSALPLAFRIKAPESLSPFGVMVGHLLSRAMEKGLKRLPAERRSETLGLWRRLRGNSRAFGRTLFFLLFSRVQLFATVFAAGALTAFCTRILFFDTAFGWQTTLGESAAPQVVHRLAEGIALPWSWCFPQGVGTPTLEAVAGSRILLKEGIEGLSGAHLTAWWPFLAMGLLVYGLLPRICLLIASRRGLGKAVHRELLAWPQVRLLLDSVSGPSLATRVTEARRAEEAEAELNKRKSVTPRDNGDPGLTPARPTVLVPEELQDMIPELTHHLAAPLMAPEIITVSMEAPAQHPKPHGRLYLVQEAWQAPIRETLDWIVDLRQSCPKHTPLTILLTGEMAEGTLDVPEEGHVNIWRKVVAALALPGLRVEVIKAEDS
ncbi:DUF2868 domain-containing protein [Desulfoluna spongiiphila]|uniref:DUF2868 domain-containing protein n=1 Tax=Desulfoluna spongiiphila TaxID=419481 RepID=A0A1G5EP92_9BACT|nr:DUF2868 domain-containing protein [Desulfoluna spongiiphila]SCY28789.1 Protein of unknown function [Desulfoluna spongiiphila]